MTKLELEAIRALPEEWVRDGTGVLTVGGKVIAMNSVYLPVVYDSELKSWSQLSLDAVPIGLRFVEMGPPVKFETVPLMQWHRPTHESG